MLLKNSNTQRMQRLIRSLICLTYVFCATITTAEQPSSETAINLPALKKPGMEDELISVNFDQVDIRIMLKTIGDITGINFVVDDSVKGTGPGIVPQKNRLEHDTNIN